MSEFRVSPKKISTYSQEIKQISGMIGECAADVQKIGNAVTIGGSSGSGIRTILQKISDNMAHNRKETDQMSSALGRIAVLYTYAEDHAAQGYETPKKTTEKKNGTVRTAAENIGKAKTSEEPQNEAAVISAMAGLSGKVLGFGSSGEVRGDVLGATWNSKITSGAKWKTETDANGKTVRKLDSLELISAEVGGEAYLARGRAKGNIGLLRGEADVKVGTVAGKGRVSAALYKDGKLNPQLAAGAEVSAVAVQGKAQGAVGTENTNVHMGAEGKLGTAKAKADVGIGKVSYTDSKGKEVEGYGVRAEAGAEAYAAEGKVSGGITIFGVKVDVGVTGKIGGAGAKVGGAATTGGVKGGVSLGAGAGVGLDFSIDWSGFKWGW